MSDEDTRESDTSNASHAEPPTLPDPPEPTLTRVFTMDIDVSKPIEVGETGRGNRRIIPIVGGTVSGRIEGRVLDSGADFQLYRETGPTDIVARYALETTEGDRIYVKNRGMRVYNPEPDAISRDGELIEQEAGYFATTPAFEVAADHLQWLEEHVFVMTGARHSNGVHVGIFRVD